MNLNFGLQHQVNVTQQLNLAPQLLQWLRILQIPTTDLGHMVQRELETNPALESDAPASLETGPAADSAVDDTVRELEPGDTALTEKLEALAELDSDWGDGSVNGRNGSGSGSAREEQERYDYRFDAIASRESLQEHLLKQIALSGMPADRAMLSEMIVGSLNEKGYLATPLDDLAVAADRPLAEMEAALFAVQTIAPAGVGARDLKECLLLQMRDRRNSTLPRAIVTGYLDVLARGQYTAIAESLEVAEEDVLDAAAFIRTLTPNPADEFESHITHYVEPDVIVRQSGDNFEIEITDDRIPRLRLSASCKRLIAKGTLQPHELAYVRDRLRSAAFLIQGITQRRETLRKVTEQIVRAQRDYLGKPDGRLKPLTMARVAAIIGVHETTVSRALANKYISTPHGLFEMRHFFRNGYRCADGSALTPEAVKELIAEIIEKEEPGSPLRDIDISSELKRRGLTIARRTIAKYREELGIPMSKERKHLAARTSRGSLCAAA